VDVRSIRHPDDIQHYIGSSPTSEQAELFLDRSKRHFRYPCEVVPCIFVLCTTDSLDPKVPNPKYSIFSGFVLSSDSHIVDNLLSSWIIANNLLTHPCSSLYADYAGMRQFFEMNISMLICAQKAKNNTDELLAKRCGMVGFLALEYAVRCQKEFISIQRVARLNMLFKALTSHVDPTSAHNPLLPPQGDMLDLVKSLFEHDHSYISSLDNTERSYLKEVFPNDSFYQPDPDYNGRGQMFSTAKGMEDAYAKTLGPDFKTFNSKLEVLDHDLNKTNAVGQEIADSITQAAASGVKASMTLESFGIMLKEISADLTDSFEKSTLLFSKTIVDAKRSWYTDLVQFLASSITLGICINYADSKQEVMRLLAVYMASNVASLSSLISEIATFAKYMWGAQDPENRAQSDDPPPVGFVERIITAIKDFFLRIFGKAEGVQATNTFKNLTNKNSFFSAKNIFEAIQQAYYWVYYEVWNEFHPNDVQRQYAIFISKVGDCPSTADVEHIVSLMCEWKADWPVGQTGELERKLQDAKHALSSMLYIATHAEVTLLCQQNTQKTDELKARSARFTTMKRLFSRIPHVYDFKNSMTCLDLAISKLAVPIQHSIISAQLQTIKQALYNNATKKSVSGRERFEECLRIDRELWILGANYPDAWKFPPFRDLYTANNKVALELSTTDYIYRPPPVIVKLESMPAVGKTTLVEVMTALVAERMKTKYPFIAYNDQLYSRNLDDPFWSGYNGQSSVLFDDAFQIMESVRAQQVAAQIIALGNCSPYLLNMATLGEKSTPFNSKIIWFTGNNRIAFPTIDGVTSKQAMTRRIDFNLEVKRFDEGEECEYLFWKYDPQYFPGNQTGYTCDEGDNLIQNHKPSFDTLKLVEAICDKIYENEQKMKPGGLKDKLIKQFKKKEPSLFCESTQVTMTNSSTTPVDPLDKVAAEIKIPSKEDEQSSDEEVPLATKQLPQIPNRNSTPTPEDSPPDEPKKEYFDPLGAVESDVAKQIMDARARGEKVEIIFTPTTGTAQMFGWSDMVVGSFFGLGKFFGQFAPPTRSATIAVGTLALGTQALMNSTYYGEGPAAEAIFESRLDPIDMQRQENALRADDYSGYRMEQFVAEKNRQINYLQKWCEAVHRRNVRNEWMGWCTMLCGAILLGYRYFNTGKAQVAGYDAVHPSAKVNLIPKPGRAQASDTDDVMLTIMRNVPVLSIYDDSGALIRKQAGLGVHERTLVTTAHFFWDLPETASTLSVIFQDFEQKFPLKDTKRVRFGPTENDYVFIELPNLGRSFRAIKHFFPKRDQVVPGKLMGRTAVLHVRRGQVIPSYGEGKYLAQAFTYTTDYDKYTVPKHYRTSVESDDGDCGGPHVLAEAPFGNCRIVGIHVAGSINRFSVATIVTQEDIEDFLKPPLLPTPEVGHAQTREIKMPKSVEIIGRSEIPTHIPNTTKFVPTGWSEFVPYECTKKPVNLKPFKNALGEKVSPLELNLAKFSPVEGYEPKEPTISIQKWLAARYPMSDLVCRRLTLDEAINSGPHLGAHFLPLKVSSASGVIPDGYEKLGNKKIHYFQFKRDYNNRLCINAYNKRPELELLPEVEKAYHVWVDKVHKGESTANYTLTLKDELLPIESVDAGKARLFCAADLFTVIYLRQVLGWLHISHAQSRVGDVCQIGVNPLSYEWTILHDYITDCSQRDELFAGDIKAADKVGNEFSASGVYLVVNDLLRRASAPPTFVKEVNNALDLIFKTGNYLLLDYILRILFKTPSGIPCTSDIQSIQWFMAIVTSQLEIVYDRALESGKDPWEEMSTWYNELRVIFFGDDHVGSQGDSVEKVDVPTLAAQLLTHGITYTDPQKKPFLPKSYTIDTVRFLQRTFTRVQGRVLGRLTLDTVRDIPFYIDKKRINELPTHFDSWFIELSLFGKEIYDREIALAKEGLAFFKITPPDYYDVSIVSKFDNHKPVYDHKTTINMASHLPFEDGFAQTLDYPNQKEAIDQSAQPNNAAEARIIMDHFLQRFSSLSNPPPTRVNIIPKKSTLQGKTQTSEGRGQSSETPQATSQTTLAPDMVTIVEDKATHKDIIGVQTASTTAPTLYNTIANPLSLPTGESSITGMFKIRTINWSSTSGTGTMLDGFSLLYEMLKIPQLNTRLNYWYMLNTGITVLVRVEGNDSLAGCLGMAIHEHEAVGNNVQQNFLQIFSMPHILVSANSPDPFLYTMKDWNPSRGNSLDQYDMTTLKNNNNIWVHVLAPLVAVNTTSAFSVNVSVYAKFDDPKLFIPTYKTWSFPTESSPTLGRGQSAEGKSATTSGLISAPVERVKNLLGIVKKVHNDPTQLADLALDQTISGLKSIGLDTPMAPSLPVPSILVQGTSPSLMHGAHVGYTLAGRPDSKVSDDYKMFDKINYMDFENYGKIPGIVATGTINASSSAGAVLSAIPVDPMWCYQLGGSAISEIIQTPMMNFTKHFTYWEGAISYALVIYASPWLRCKIAVAWDPLDAATSAPSTLSNAQLGSLVHIETEIAGDTVIPFSIPFISKRPVKYVRADPLRNVTGASNGYGNGRVLINLTTPVTSSFAGNTSLTWYLLAKTGPGYRVYNPRAISTNYIYTDLRSGVETGRAQSKETHVEKVKTHDMIELFKADFPFICDAHQSTIDGVCFGFGEDVKSWKELASRYCSTVIWNNSAAISTLSINVSNLLELINVANQINPITTIAQSFGGWRGSLVVKPVVEEDPASGLGYFNRLMMVSLTATNNSQNFDPVNGILIADCNLMNGTEILIPYQLPQQFITWNAMTGNIFNSEDDAHYLNFRFVNPSGTFYPYVKLYFRVGDDFVCGRPLPPPLYSAISSVGSTDATAKKDNLLNKSVPQKEDKYFGFQPVPSVPKF